MSTCHDLTASTPKVTRERPCCTICTTFFSSCIWALWRRREGTTHACLTRQITLEDRRGLLVLARKCWVRSSRHRLRSTIWCLLARLCRYGDRTTSQFALLEAHLHTQLGSVSRGGLCRYVNTQTSGEYRPTTQADYKASFQIRNVADQASMGISIGSETADRSFISTEVYALGIFRRGPSQTGSWHRFRRHPPSSSPCPVSCCDAAITPESFAHTHGNFPLIGEITKQAPRTFGSAPVFRGSGSCPRGSHRCFSPSSAVSRRPCDRPQGRNSEPSLEMTTTVFVR